MLGLGFQIGIQPPTFWELTPLEFSILIKAFNEKEKREHDMRIVTAYLTAYWHRVKKMPSLKQVLGQSTKTKKTPEEMLEMVKRLNEAFGGNTVAG